MSPRKPGQFRSWADGEAEDERRKQQDFRLLFRDWWGFLLFKLIFWVPAILAMPILFGLVAPWTSGRGWIGAIALALALGIPLLTWMRAAQWIARRVRG